MIVLLKTLLFVLGIQLILLVFLRDRIEILLAEGCIIVPAVIFVKNRKYSFSKVFRLKPVSVHIIILSVIIGLALIAPIDELDRIIRKILPVPEDFLELENNLAESLKVKSAYNFAILFLSGAFIASIVEEMLFRGFLQGVLERNMDITRAVMITALIFAIVHFWPWHIIQILILGVFLGVMVWKSGSIIPAIIVHFIINSFSLIIVNFQLKTPGWFTWMGHVSPIILIFSLILLYYSFKLFYILNVKYIEEENL